jgi:hypothetical protein
MKALIPRDKKLLEKIHSCGKFNYDIRVSGNERQKTSVGVAQPSSGH